MNPYDLIIPPEIVADDFARAITRAVARPGIRSILEIGSSSGNGSTLAIVAGMAEDARLYTIEASTVRQRLCAQRWSLDPRVYSYNGLTVGPEQIAPWGQVEEFCRENRWPDVHTVRGWYTADVAFYESLHVPDGLIRWLKSRLPTPAFDAVLIDGGEFSAQAELDEVIGTKIIMLDDVYAFKNHENYQRLLADGEGYKLIDFGEDRQGFAIFERQ